MATDEFSIADILRRVGRLEDQVDNNVVLEKAYSADLRALEHRLQVLEEAIREQAKSQAQTYRAMFLMFLGVLVEAAVIAIKLGG